jgi:hypothetical protein
MALTEREFNDRCRDFSKDVMEWLDGHEAEVHDGGFCSDERGNLLAWLTHRMGYDRETFVAMVERLDWYDAQCSHGEMDGHRDSNGAGPWLG